MVLNVGNEPVAAGAIHVRVAEQDGKGDVPALKEGMYITEHDSDESMTADIGMDADLRDAADGQRLIVDTQNFVMAGDMGDESPVLGADHPAMLRHVPEEALGPEDTVFLLGETQAEQGAQSGIHSVGDAIVGQIDRGLNIGSRQGYGVVTGFYYGKLLELVPTILHIRPARSMVDGRKADPLFGM